MILFIQSYVGHDKDVLVQILNHHKHVESF